MHYMNRIKSLKMNFETLNIKLTPNITTFLTIHLWWVCDLTWEGALQKLMASLKTKILLYQK